MQAPSTGLGLLLIVLFLLPGAVYGFVLDMIDGPLKTVDFSLRVLRAIALSTILIGLYLWFFGKRLAHPYWKIANGFDKSTRQGADAVVANISGYGRTGLLLLFVIPALAAMAWAAMRNVAWVRKVLRLGETAPPSAWDRAFAGRTDPYWVRILTKDGDWVGGGVDSRGFVTSYPATPQIIISVPWRMSDQGEFVWDNSFPSRSLLVSCDGARAVEVLSDIDTAGDGLIGKRA